MSQKTIDLLFIGLIILVYVVSFFIKDYLGLGFNVMMNPVLPL